MTAKTNQSRSRFERDREMVNNPMGWPQLRLPMKNPGRYNTEQPNLGWLWASMEWPGDERTVYFGNIFDRDSSGSEVYQDTEAMLDAGWTVD